MQGKTRKTRYNSTIYIIDIVSSTIKVLDLAKVGVIWTQFLQSVFSMFKIWFKNNNIHKICLPICMLKVWNLTPMVSNHTSYPRHKNQLFFDISDSNEVNKLKPCIYQLQLMPNKTWPARSNFFFRSASNVIRVKTRVNHLQSSFMLRAGHVLIYEAYFESLLSIKQIY